MSEKSKRKNTEFLSEFQGCQPIIYLLFLTFTGLMAFMVAGILGFWIIMLILIP
jgi:hypothetical protein